MSLEQKVNYQLSKYPAVKRVIKRAYQLMMYTISPKIKSEGNIIKLSPDADGEYFSDTTTRVPGMRLVVMSFA